MLPCYIKQKGWILSAKQSSSTQSFKHPTNSYIRIAGKCSILSHLCLIWDQEHWSCRNVEDIKANQSSENTSRDDLPPPQMRLKDIKVEFESNNLPWDHLNLPKHKLYYTTSKIGLVIPNMHSYILTANDHPYWLFRRLPFQFNFCAHQF